MQKSRNSGHLSSRAKAELLNSHKGSISYYLFIQYLKFLNGLRHICPDARIMNSDEADKKASHLRRVERSQERLGNLDALSIIIRKLRFPFLTNIEYFDKHTKLIAGKKLEKLLQVIPPETMTQLHTFGNSISF